MDNKKVNPDSGANKNDGATVSFVIDRERRQRGGIDPKKLLAELKTYSFPKDKDKITNLLSYIENEAFKVDSDNLMVLIDNLAKWAREAREVRATGFLQQIASCARKMDALGESDIDIFFALWKIVPEIANSIGDCKKVITNVIDSHSDDFDIVISGLLPFFRKADNYQQLPEFFKLVFPEEDNNNNRDLVSSAWNAILCDKEINDILEKSRYFATPNGKEFAKHVEKHSDGREMPKALLNYRKNSKIKRIKMLGMGAAVVAVSLVIAIVAVIIAGNAIDTSSIVIDYPTEITLNWGDEIDLGGRFITYKTNNGNAFEVPLTDATVRGFDNPRVGNNTVTIEYKGKTHNVIVKVNPIVLQAPEIKLSNGSIVWNSVAADGKCEYKIILADVNGNELTPGTVTSDGGVFTSVLPESLETGKYTVKVVAKSTSSEYADSAEAICSFEKQKGVANVRYENKRIQWDKVNNAKGYIVNLNGTDLPITVSNSIECTLIGGINEILVGVVYDGNVVFEKTALSIYKKEAPQINIQNGVLYADDNVKLKIGSTEFTKDELDSLTVNAATYKITAQVLATEPGEIDSDIVTIDVVRLPKPQLAINNDTLAPVGQTGYEIKYFIKSETGDYEVFDGNILDKEIPGKYYVKAQFVGQEGVTYALPSVESNEVSFTKLPAPSITQVGTSISIENAHTKYELYLNGELFKGTIDGLPSGFHEITARNVGDGMNTITSAQSNPVRVGKIKNTTVSLTPVKNSSGEVTGIRVTVTPDFDTTEYPVTLKVFFTKHNGEKQTEETLIYNGQYTFLYVIGDAERIDVTITVMYSDFDEITLGTESWSAN